MFLSVVFSGGARYNMVTFLALLYTFTLWHPVTQFFWLITNIHIKFVLTCARLAKLNIWPKKMWIRVTVTVVRKFGYIRCIIENITKMGIMHAIQDIDIVPCYLPSSFSNFPSLTSNSFKIGSIWIPFPILFCDSSRFIVVKYIYCSEMNILFVHLLHLSGEVEQIASNSLHFSLSL